MRHLKKFENINTDIKVGDYVIMKCDNTTNRRYIDFLKHYIGIVSSDIVSSFNHMDEYNILRVRFYDIPDLLRRDFSPTKYDGKTWWERNYYVKDIVEYAETVEELKMKIEANTYNL